MEIQTINAQRRSELRSDNKYIHVMKYMGSKRELLPDIKDEVDKILKGQGGVLDLFAGTGSVGMYLQDSYNIISNDIQNYSKVICNALIGEFSKDKMKGLTSNLTLLRTYFEENQSSLTKYLSETLNRSNSFVNVPKRSWTNDKREAYLQFFGTFPNPTNNFNSPADELKNLWRMYNLRNKSIETTPYLQTTLLFAETYFSLQQCIDIDSLRYAIDNVFEEGSREHDIALTGLIYAHSYCSSGTGHFAMYRDLKDVKSINDVFLYRDRSVFDYFEKKVNEILIFLRHSNGHNHFATSLNYIDVLSSAELAKKYDLIYADPPYSFVHYSRFYHATESLVKYDYMIPEYKGRYRTDRHQSPFCQSQNVQLAFEEIFKLGSQHRKAILLSYSNTGMISSDDILTLALKYKYKASITELNYDHSTMGRQGHKSNSIKEYLITFTLT